MAVWTVIVSRLDELVFAPEVYVNLEAASWELERWASCLSRLELVRPEKVTLQHLTVGSFDVRLARLADDLSPASQLWVSVYWSWLGGVESVSLFPNREQAWRWASSLADPGMVVRPEISTEDRLRVSISSEGMFAAVEARPAKLVVESIPDEAKSVREEPKKPVA